MPVRPADGLAPEAACSGRWELENQPCRSRPAFAITGPPEVLACEWHLPDLLRDAMGPERGAATVTAYEGPDARDHLRHLRHVSSVGASDVGEIAHRWNSLLPPVLIGLPFDCQLTPAPTVPTRHGTGSRATSSSTEHRPGSGRLGVLTISSGRDSRPFTGTVRWPL